MNILLVVWILSVTVVFALANYFKTFLLQKSVNMESLHLKVLNPNFIITRSS